MCGRGADEAPFPWEWHMPPFAANLRRVSLRGRPLSTLSVQFIDHILRLNASEIAELEYVLLLEV